MDHTLRERTNPLGAFLRARREAITPGQAGIPHHGVRRTPGLRREEVAMLAGISADYYLRLERGKDSRPSVQVLTAIARVLQLDDVHTAHLMALGCEAPTAPRPPEVEVPPSVRTLLDSLGHAAFVEDRFFDVRASNELARALSPRLVPGANQLRALFLDPAERSLYPDWHLITDCWVASLRQVSGSDADDPQLVSLVDELSASPRFRELWARHEVRVQDSGRVRMDHPEVGDLTLHRDRLAISGATDLHLVVLHPDPGTIDAAKVAVLQDGVAGGLPDPRLNGALVAP
jgi:transcriptional regulator with XRE-family HTH domain